MDDVLVPLTVVPTIFIGLPWLIFHYVTKWKTSATLTREDENLLDELHEMARRLDERVHTVERILTADNPNWKSSSELEAPAPAHHQPPLNPKFARRIRQCPEVARNSISTSRTPNGRGSAQASPIIQAPVT